jgi:holo-[acyl-carrier protein] synthase
VAALVASKEAFFKALGTGLVQPLRWVDVAVGGSMRAPTLCWSGAAAAALAALGGVSARLSLSGDKIFTLAAVILFDCQEAGPPGHVFAASPPGSEDPEPCHTALAHKRCTARVGGRLPQRP